MNTKVFMALENSHDQLADALNLVLKDIEDEGGEIKDIKFSTTFDPSGQKPEVWFSAMVIYWVEQEKIKK